VPILSQFRSLPLFLSCPIPCHFGEMVRDSRHNVDVPLLEWLAHRVIPSLEQPVLAMIAEAVAVERALNG
jgi:hypothetical protein